MIKGDSEEKAILIGFLNNSFKYKEFIPTRMFTPVFDLQEEYFVQLKHKKTGIISDFKFNKDFLKEYLIFLS